MFKNVVVLYILSLSCASAFSSEAEPSQAEVSAMNAMKYKADVLGIKLGMPATEARALTQSAIPKAHFGEYSDSARQPTGWVAVPNTCRAVNDAACDERIEVRVAGGKVWFVSRVKSYDKDKGQELPGFEATKNALFEKYGPLAKTNPKYLQTYYAFQQGKHGRTGVEKCGGGNNEPPSSFSPNVNWYYEIHVGRASDNAFVDRLKVALIDCQYMFDLLNQKKQVDAAAADEVRQKELAKGVKPKL